MGTRTRIIIESEGEYLCSKYIRMDGHIYNWAPKLITALNKTNTKSILKNRQLLEFMIDNYVVSDNFSYVCKVDISNDDYKIVIYDYKDEVIFEGGLNEFSDKYDKIH